MGKSYLGQRENILTSEIILFCSYGETLSRLPGKVSVCDVALSKSTIEKLLNDRKFSGKVGYMLCSYGQNIIPCTEISPVNKRDLGTRENFSSHMNAVELFILSHNKARW